MATQFNELTDSQWEIISCLFNIQRKRKNSLRSILNAILYITRVGGQWRNLPPSMFPKWQLVYYYFRLWSRDGTIEHMNFILNWQARKAAGRECTPSMCCVDSQSVKLAPMIKEERGLDGNKKINGRKRQALTDTTGLIWAVFVHAANEHDSIMGCELLERTKGYFERLEKILIDAGYKGTFVETAREEYGIEAEVSSKPPSEKGFIPVKWRWTIERTFGWLNFYRRLSKDYEKTTLSAESWILLANCTIAFQRIAELSAS
jgi:transposase